ncbi:MAG: hypothetical protein EAZ73_09255 [Oscillatoriales cyanobacterium]|uniref:hypothetical protein n=1 Tax=unclassified Microcoleus TaxID=2642155 RepID=UPI001D8DD506|nr:MULTISPECIES: hypothetical protein [unclassified Microcoleus]TAF00839.1 MAG: hypothetical protein EAZ79_01340 [Oscillatoriales cyanobacterium]MCC3459823.1 hypothetical protein [Microcoleus sp. PH2017_11_PCY_U_A]MCC3478256.1 hypothetical protein [Microcoleus sp. PH2017_12_PCY_D_A]TAF21402.1 MAG: hypothetical protein EAZ73_09255 [Oscillatoriales cyanobacterium]TAF39671.1 MAG: hypothetical protein EAZ69_00090 [Oscillatoriales cyanobacterium]
METSKTKESVELLELLDRYDWATRGIFFSAGILAANIGRAYPELLRLSIAGTFIATGVILFYPPRSSTEKSLWRSGGIALFLGFAAPWWESLKYVTIQHILIAVGAIALFLMLLGMLGGNDD